MGRWQPDARGRLAQAALELYGERGFEQTTVAEIAERAGLTERTFFRHYADKPEVLFGGADELRELLVRGVADAPPAASAMEAAAAGLEAVAGVLGERLEYSRRRNRIIAANPELRERELIKLASWAGVLGEALRGRGVAAPAARLAAEVAVAVFGVAFERWLDEGDRRGLTELIRDSLAQLTALADPS